MTLTVRRCFQFCNHDFRTLVTGISGEIKASNDKFIEISEQRFLYFKDPVFKFFALNLLFQGTSYSLALKYSSFLLKFFSFAFYNINFWFEINKICPKILHFSQISHSRGNTDITYRNKQGSP